MTTPTKDTAPLVNEGGGLISNPRVLPEVTLSPVLSNIGTITCRGGIVSHGALQGAHNRDTTMIGTSACDHFEVSDDKETLVSESPQQDCPLGSTVVDDVDLLDPGRVAPADILSDNNHDCHPHLLVTLDDRTSRNKLIIVSICCILFMIAEIVGGFLSNSLALVTDASHLACDLAGFLVSLLAIWLARRPPTARLSFGFHRAEVIGALMSVSIIWVVAGVLVYLAVLRVKDPNYEIKADVMLVTSALGVGFNLVMGVVLHSGLVKKCQLRSSLGHGHSHGGHSNLHHSHAHDQPNLRDTNHRSHQGYDSFNERDTNLQQLPPGGVEREDFQIAGGLDGSNVNINVRAAFVHVIGDLIQSVGVFIAAIIIKVKPEYKLADPVCTFIASALVLITTAFVIRDVGLIIMEAVPRGLNLSVIKDDLSRILGVKSVHSCHAWALTIDKLALTVHLAVDSLETSWPEVVKKATKVLRERHHIYMPTVQVEEFDRELMANCSQCIS